ncbi:hypothetical protein [Wolbachia endosymbiont (group E) of Neria commutata]|uniref:hypothetical protein n=1 Tax=Wolbachia endosymbiont (group E) of Neria commutata TaxID=3066149 RepID=UPI00313343FB
MVKVLNNMIQGKGKVIAVAIAIALVVTGFSALVMLTAISIVMKIAIIAVVVAAVIFTYLGLSIPSFIKKFRAEKNDVSAKTEEQPDISEDGIDPGYGTEDDPEEEEKENTVISAKEQKETEFQRQEDLANARECKRMEEGSLGGSINALGDPIISGPSNEIPAKIVMKSLPDSMDLYGNELPDQVICTENSHLVLGSQKPKQASYVPMESLPDSMDVFGNKLPHNKVQADSPSTCINMNSNPEQRTQKKLSAAEWLSQNAPWVLEQSSVRRPA